MEKYLALIFIISALNVHFSYADTVYFKDGTVFENAETKETGKGIWIEGTLFEKTRIDKIENKPIIKMKFSPPSQKSWWDKTMSYFSSFFKKKNN